MDGAATINVEKPFICYCRIPPSFILQPDIEFITLAEFKRQPIYIYVMVAGKLHALLKIIAIMSGKL